MRASFLHIADTHLGYEQYGVRERFNDFTRTFWDIIDDAIARRVDFVIIAGDLFNKRAIDAQTLIHAIEGLRRLKDADIPVIAIEGNHDRSYYREGVSWLQFLCYQGYLTLLSPDMQEGSPVLTPWERSTMTGAYVDLLDGQLRVYGLPWLGAATVRTMETMAAALTEARTIGAEEGIQYRLLMMHTGIEGQVARMHGLPARAHFQPLAEHIDYLALGHVHKPYEFDGWIYNPGSTETCSAEESQWEDRGYYYVEIDTDNPERIIQSERKERLHHAEHIRSSRRPFVRYELSVDGLNEPDLIYARLEDYCRRNGPTYQQNGTTETNNARMLPLVLVTLTGTLAFDSSALDLRRMEEMVKSYFQAIYVRIDNHTNDQDYAPSDNELDGRDRSLWHELERRIFEELVARDNRYLPAKEEWSRVIADLKQKALGKDDPEDIASLLREKRASLL